MTNNRSIEIDDREVMAALAALQNAGANMRPVFLDIGELLLASTKRRFETTSGPDNNEWAANSDVTIERKGRDWALTGLSGALMGTLFPKADSDGLELISPMAYAAMQQFGGTKAEFPHLWGDIPARPFLGLSDQDAEGVLGLLAEHFENAF